MARAKGTDRKANGITRELPDWVKQAAGKREVKRARGDLAPFWAPEKDKDHPKQISGTVSNVRDLPTKNKKWEPRKAFDLASEETGEVWCVTIKASLKTQGAEDLEDGQWCAVEYLGPLKIKGQKNPMHNFALYVAE